ncbi:BtpA/SgcQ family protein [Corynebacterium ulceribovis]|uniref:BtpA/SgcQ family protein n=1 Tax=Corynebacterium ulceribovis TaxID=487732 RepID=UPI00037AF656|nr:BtpA/SgcQ family protein [Corynebacterium ulceribovis]
MKAFPVVHINEVETAISQAQLALDMGSDGVYFIDHQDRDPRDTVLRAYGGLLTNTPDVFVGVNLLGSTVKQAYDILLESLNNGLIPRMPNALWCDDIRDSGTADLAELDEFRRSEPELANITLMGGIAFKYTPNYTSDPDRAAAEAKELEPYVDVVTTSGRGTGTAPDAEKIHAMKSVISKPLAVASGLSASNLHLFEGIVDQMIVGTSIETHVYSGIFNTDALEELLSAAHVQRN